MNAPIAMPSGELVVSYFAGTTDTTPRRVPYPNLAALAAKHATHEVRATKDGPLWSPAEYAPNARRSKRGVVRVHAAVLDLDKLSPSVADAVIERLTSSGRAFWVYSTWSHDEAAQRTSLRVCFSLSRALEGREWPTFFRALRDEYPESDAACSDASRIYFLPATPGDRAVVNVWSDGAPLDVEAMLTRGGGLVADTPARSASASTAPERVRVACLRKLDRACSEIRAAAFPGPIYPTLNRAAFASGRYVGGGVLTRDEVLERLDRAVDTRDTEGAYREKNRKIAREGVDAGAAWPWTPVPEIELGVDEGRVVREAIAALAGVPHVFRRGTQLVRVVGTPPAIESIPRAALRTELADAARFVLTKDDRTIEKNPPDWLVGGVLERGDFPAVRELSGIVSCPVLRDDGSVVDAEGYDERTGLFRADVGLGPVHVPDAPTPADARAKALELLEVFGDFPLADDESRGTLLSLILSPFARHVVDGPVPLFLIEASVAGAGKSLLCDVVAMIATGHVMPREAYVHDDDEMRKRITTIALGARGFTMLDNVSGAFGLPCLDAVLTGNVWTDRVLGANRSTGSLAWRTILVATANNAKLSGDMPRRAVRVRLETALENPEDRAGFKYPRITAHVREHRARLVGAALTVLRAARLVSSKRSESMGSFEAWSDLVGGAVELAGFPHPKASQRELRATGDVTKNALATLIDSMAHYASPGRARTASELVVALGIGGPLGGGTFGTVGSAGTQLLEAVAELVPSRGRGDGVTAVAFGRALAKHRGRVVGGRRIAETKPDRNGIKGWFVESVSTEGAS